MAVEGIHAYIHTYVDSGKKTGRESTRTETAERVDKSEDRVRVENRNGTIEMTERVDAADVTRESKRVPVQLMKQRGERERESACVYVCVCVCVCECVRARETGDERGKMETVRKSGGTSHPWQERQQAGSPFRKAPPKPG